MKQGKQNQVQRSLVIGVGPVAELAADGLQQRLAERQGPAAAVTALAYADPPDVYSDAFIEEVTAALNQISATSLPARLATSGWALDDVAGVALFLLLDAVDQGGELAVGLCRQITAVIRRHLGVEPAPLLLWLAAGASPAAVYHCLAVSEAQPVLFSRGVFALSLLNEAGLRLGSPQPDKTQSVSVEELVASGAELLWALIATPVRIIPDWLLATNGYTFNQKASLTSVGIYAWRWPAQATHDAFRRRWLRSVLAYWLAPAPEPISPPQVTWWANQCGLSPEGMNPYPLTPAERQLPSFPPDVWRAPWPGRLAHLLAEMGVAYEADESAHEKRVEWACLRMDEPIQAGAKAIQARLAALLDEKPVGGVAYAAQWARFLAAALDEQAGTEQQRLQQLETAVTSLAAEWEQGQAKVTALLDDWPITWAHWLRAVTAPWRWPHLARRYWQLRQWGRQLAPVLARRAAQRRQQAATMAIAQALAELARLARHFEGNVSEIGDMLRYLGEQLTVNSQQSTVNSQQLTVNSTQVDPEALEALYAQMVTNEALEAERAAAAVGGLGRQLLALDDDAILDGLRRRSRERFAAVWQLTPADVLPAIAADDDDRQQWWRQVWDLATPLWRYDEARLTEAARARCSAYTCVCSADALRLAALLETAVLFHAQNHAPPNNRWLFPAVRWLEWNDRQCILVLRLRRGLTAEAMVGEL